MKLTKKKKQQVIVIAIVVLLIVIIVHNKGIKPLGAAPLPPSTNKIDLNNNDGITLEVYTVDHKPNNFIKKLLAIVSPKSAYKRGEDIILEDYQDIQVNCNILQADLKIQNQQLTTIDSNFKTIGKAGYMTVYYKYTIPGSKSNTYPLGTLTASSQWICDSEKLGKDGCSASGATLNQCKDTTGEAPSKWDFEILSSSDIGVGEDLCKIRSCNAGEKLANSGTTDCFCQKQWSCGNSQCEIGESAVLCSQDCGGATGCQEGYVLLHGVCGDKDQICTTDGGNVDCSGFGSGKGFGLNSSTIQLLSLFGGIALVIFGLYKKYFS